MIASARRKVRVHYKGMGREPEEKISKRENFDKRKFFRERKFLGKSRFFASFDTNFVDMVLYGYILFWTRQRRIS